MVVSVLLFILGVALLFAGAESLVRGSANIARHFRVHPLIVGLTVVAFGTSAPELVVSLVAALKGSPDISLGNVVGSNIANMGLVLGLAAIVRPIAVGRKTLRQEGPVMILAQVAFVLMAVRDQVLGLTDGLILLAAMTAFTLLMVARTFSDRIEASIERACPEESDLACIFKNGLRVVGGVLGLVFGSNLMVDSGSEIALALGVSRWVIGATLVAVGTSLPELATSLVAAYRREGDISLGNVVGSNIFNVLLILGLVSTVRPLPVPPGSLHFELPVMLLFCTLAYILMITGRRLSRAEGILLVALYGIFVQHLF